MSNEHQKAVKAVWDILNNVLEQTPTTRPYIDQLESVMHDIDELQSSISAFDPSDHIQNLNDMAIEHKADAEAWR